VIDAVSRAESRRVLATLIHHFHTVAVDGVFGRIRPSR